MLAGVGFMAVIIGSMLLDGTSWIAGSIMCGLGAVTMIISIVMRRAEDGLCD